MLTKRSQDLICSIFIHATFWRIIPFKWNAKKKILVPLNGKKCISSVIIVIVYWANITYMAVTFYKNRKDNSISASSNALHTLLLIAALLSGIFGYNNVKRRNEIASFINKYLKLQTFMEGQFLPEGHKSKWNACDLMLLAFLVLTYAQSFAGTLMFINDPSQPRYFYSSIAHILPFWTALVYACIEYAMYVSYWFNVLVSLVLMLSYWFGTAYWLKQMRPQKKEAAVKYETLVHLRWLQVSLNFYTYMSVLNKSFKDSLSDVVMPWTQFLIILIPAFCNFILIRFHHLLNIFPLTTVFTLSVSCIAILCLGYPVAASINSLSSSYLASFKWAHIAPNVSPFQRKRAGAARPLSIQVGTLLFIRSFTVLKLINAIIYWTMRSLLISKKS